MPDGPSKSSTEAGGGWEGLGRGQAHEKGGLPPANSTISVVPSVARDGQGSGKELNCSLETSGFTEAFGALANPFCAQGNYG